MYPAHLRGTEKKDPLSFTPKQQLFWNSVSNIASSPQFPMLLLTGTASRLAEAVYDRPENVWPNKVQRSKFPRRWLESRLTAIENMLMLLRQPEQHFRSAGERWVPSFASSQAEPSFATVTAQVDAVHPEDVVLALAL